MIQEGITCDNIFFCIKLTSVRGFFAAQWRKMYQERVKQDLRFVVQQLPDTIFSKSTRSAGSSILKIFFAGSYSVFKSGII